MDFQTKRRLAKFLRITEPFVDLVGILSVIGFCISFLPAEVLNKNPATGGDTGSHFWPLVTLVQHGLPNLSVRVWNPGNLGGEPHLVHYFPFPFLVMAFLSLFMPLGMAFNLGSILPLITMPLTVYFCLRGLRLRFPLPLLGATSSLIFIFNEGYSMWGGNTLSTLAGQFAHVYALNFLFLGVGALAYEIRAKRFPFFSSLLFAAIATSHAYVLLGVPFFFLSLLFHFSYGKIKERFKLEFLSGVFSIFLSLWFLVPMINNSRWTTPFPIKWYFGNFWEEVVPVIFHPVFVVLAIGIFFLPFEIRKSWRKFFKTVNLLALFWLLPIAGYVGYYFLFVHVGLVDVRAIPQIQVFVCILGGILIGHALLVFGRMFSVLLVLPLVFSTAWWVESNVSKYEPWLKWNYSGWEAKTLYPNLAKLSEELKGDFSDLRVIYEHNELNNGTGTPRVFEMLPYFAGRATLEGLYLQATILAPMVFRLQAEVSKTPSCPFTGFDCPRFDLPNAEPRLKLFGVGDFILITQELITQARASAELEEKGTHGMWHLFRYKNPPKLVELFSAKPEIITDKNWKDRFYQWFKDYTGTQNFLAVDINQSLSVPDDVWTATPGCEPKVKVEFNKLHLSTTCPGKAHLLKFAYHPTFKSDSGDQTFIASPGYIGIIPSKSDVTLTFGKSLLWRLSSITSVLSFGLLCYFAFGYRRSKNNGLSAIAPWRESTSNNISTESHEIT